MKTDYNKFIPVVTAWVCALALAGCSHIADNETSTDSLVQLLTGEFDSGEQAQTDKIKSVPKDKSHGWINRIFVKVDAPDMGMPVLIGSTRYGGDKWIADDNEFIVWSFSKTADDPSLIKMSPRRFQDLDTKKAFVRRPDKLNDFGPQDLEPAISGAACDIMWRKTPTGFSGQSDPCQIMSTTHDQILNWDWQFTVSADGMTIAYSGTDNDGNIIEQTPPDKPYILKRLDENAEYYNGRYILFNPQSRSDFAKAVTWLERAVVENDSHAAAHLMLGYAYIKTNDYDKAKASLARARAIVSDLSERDSLWLDALEARVADDPVRDIAAWKALLDAYPDSRWAWYELASQYYRAENYEAATQAIDQALALQSDEDHWGASFIYYLQSKAYARMGDYERAIDAAEPGIRNPSTRRATYYRKIIAQIAAGDIVDPSRALATYSQYYYDNGSKNEAVLKTNIALLFFELGDYDKAVEFAKEAHTISATAYPSWALGYALTEQGYPQNAMPYFNAALKSYPDNVNLYAGKAWAFYRLGDYEKAYEYGLKARAKSPRKNAGVERDLKIIQSARANPETPQVPKMRWFGD